MPGPMDGSRANRIRFGNDEVSYFEEPASPAYSDRQQAQQQLPESIRDRERASQVLPTLNTAGGVQFRNTFADRSAHAFPPNAAMEMASPTTLIESPMESTPRPPPAVFQLPGHANPSPMYATAGPHEQVYSPNVRMTTAPALRAEAYDVSHTRRDSEETLYDETAVAQKKVDSAVPHNPAPRGTGQPIKPALRRSSTEDHLRQLAAQQALNLVQHHTDAIAGEHDEESGAHRSGPRGAGVLSNLLRLYGDRPAPRRTMSANTSSEWGPDSVAQSRNPSNESIAPGARPGMRRSHSMNSIATSINECVVDEYDPRLRKAEPEPAPKRPGLAGRWSFSDNGDDAESIHSRKSGHWKRRRSSTLDLDTIYNAVNGKAAQKKQSKRKKNRLEVAAHVADIIQRQGFILKLAKALMSFGAPSHRLEAQLNATARVLRVDAQFVHIPSVVVASFGDLETRTSETHFVKAGGGLDLGKLYDVHTIYKAVIHDEIGVEEGSVALTRLLRSKPIYNLWQRMLIAAVCAGVISPMGFGGSFVDAWVSAACGAVLAFLQLHAAQKNAVYSNIFEISIAALISFVARALSTTHFFCYEAVSSAGVVLVLPGFVVLAGSLELASRNLIAGSVRMVYAIIYTLFLGFSISIGSEVFFLFAPSARHDIVQVDRSTYTISGTFDATNTSQSFAGDFTFSNATTVTKNDPSQALQKGNIMCYRDPEWEWWRSSVSPWWLFLLVPMFSTALSLWNLQPIRSRELPVMIFIACVGFATNKLANAYIFDRSDVVSFIGATAIGILGNMYSRIFGGTSFTSMATGVLFLVPGGIAAAGGLAMSQKSDGYASGVQIGFRMIQVSIGITVGLFFASFLVYSVGSKRKAGGLGFAF